MRKVIAVLFGFVLGAGGAEPGPGFLSTALTADQLDPAEFRQYFEGTERPLAVKEGPRHVVWTRDGRPEWDGVKFGDSKTPGPRHLRVGFKAAVTVGTVLVRGGGQLGVLKPTASYPGNLAQDDDWLPAERLRKTDATHDEVAAEEFALWVLPPGTRTRALRFTHRAEDADKSFAGWLGGVWVLGERMANLAPQAVASASARNEAAAKLNDSNNNGLWGAWDNGKEGAEQPLSPEHPEWTLLVWPREVTLRGLATLWTGFGACDAQVFTGPTNHHPREAAESEWRNVATFTNLNNGYPFGLWPNWLDFGQSLTTRAVRLRLTRTTTEQHPHLKNNTRQGRRVWLGEWLALHPLGEADLQTAVLPADSAPPPHPPIPVRFELPEAGLVTLVIDDAQGHRVRNLLAETPFPAGSNVAWWDGMDDLQRDAAAAHHGIYHIPERFVAPGSFRLRGLWRKPVDLRYEFAVYNPGNPPWETADSTGAWLANHTPPCGVLFLPAERAPGGQPLVYLGSFVSEGGHGLAWVDLEGRKVGGVGWVGGNWTGGPFLARDDGPAARTNVSAYVAAPWSVESTPDRAKEKRGEVRLTAITSQGMKPVFKYFFTPSFATNSAKSGDGDWFAEFGGLAARDGRVVFSLAKLNQLVWVDGRAGAGTNPCLGTTAVPNPRGLAFDAHGRLLVLSGTRLLRFQLANDSLQLPAPEVVTTNLADPRHLTLDKAGNLYVSDQGQSHQVKVFTPAGRLIRAIGTPGAPKAGRYDPNHLNHPAGLTIDGRQRLWVAENDYQPKRVSVWTLEGKLLRAFYGPSEYGGGGTLDPQDKTRFYFHGMEFKLDWERAQNQITRVFWRSDSTEFEVPNGHGSGGMPERPFYVKGKRYFANCDNSNPTGGPGVATLWVDEGQTARPVAALGRANDWDLLRSTPFQPLWPKGLDPKGDRGRNPAFFVWSDLNGDGRVQTNEVVLTRNQVGSVNVMPDLAFAVSRVGDLAMRFAPKSFTPRGVPVYDLAASEVLARDTQGPASSGGDQVLYDGHGWTILTTPPKPFHTHGLAGVFRGEPRWSYPSLWPGLHASHESPPPAFPGMVLGTTRLLGGFVTPRQGEAGPLWGINGNQGNMYLFTVDGLFVAELFRDVRVGKSWSMPAAHRGMLLNTVSLHDENFWPTLTQTRQGEIYLCDGGRSSLVRVEGLESVRRLPERTLEVTAADLQQARAFFVEAEARRQQAQGRGVLTVTLRSNPPTVDGRFDDWAGAAWVDIDKSGVPAYFDSNSKPHDVTASVCVAGDRLYAAWRADDDTLLRNSGEQAGAPFKTGGALDLMLGCSSRAADSRTKAAEGDVRLLITQVKGKTLALLYRAVVPGVTDPVPFSSPWRTITLDRVEDVSASVQLGTAFEKEPNGRLKSAGYEISIPLAVLGLQPQAGLVLRGDIGLLRGNGFQTLQRVYWANKATGITADVPSEAELTPQLWGRWEFR